MNWILNLHSGKVLAAVLVCFLGSSLSDLLAQETRRVPVDAVIYDLKHPDAERRREAAILLGRERVRAAVPALLEASDDPDDRVRLEVVRALVRINDTRALQAYIRLTRDGRREIQEKAIEGLINMYVVEEGGFISGLKKFVDFVNPFGDDYDPLVVESYMPVSAEAIRALADLLESRESALRRQAAAALGILRGRAVLPEVQQRLTRERDNGVRVELIRAIYKIGDVEAAETVVPFIQDSDRRVRDEAIFATSRLRVPSAVTPLREMYELGITERRRFLRVVPVSGADDLQRRLLEALAYLGDESCREIFLDALEEERDFYRRYGAEGLGRMGDRAFTSLVARKYVQETSAGDAKLAMSFALFRLGREEHLIELVASLDRGDQAFFYLLEIEPEEIELLYPFARSERDAVKVRLLEVIGLRGKASALPFLQEFSSSRNTDVLSAANLAMRRIQGRETPS